MIITPRQAVEEAAGSILFEWDICGWSVEAFCLKSALLKEVGPRHESLLHSIIESRFDMDGAVEDAKLFDPELDDEGAWAYAQESMDLWIYDEWSSLQRDLSMPAICEHLCLEWGRNLTVTSAQCESASCLDMVEFHGRVCDSCRVHYCHLHEREADGVTCYCGHEPETLELVSESIDFFRLKPDAVHGGGSDDNPTPDGRRAEALGEKAQPG